MRWLLVLMLLGCQPSYMHWKGQDIDIQGADTVYIEIDTLYRENVIFIDIDDTTKIK